jgi:LysM repeat protein
VATATSTVLRRLQRLTASTTASGVMLVGTPVALEYVVRPGDTLSEIADRHGTSVSRLVRRNGLDPSGDVIRSGSTLRIPAAHGRRSPAARERRSPARRKVDPDKRRIRSYTVRPGDTPSGLAVRFHAWTSELIAMNGPVLRVGERIRIPVVVAAVVRERRQHRRQAQERPHRSRRPLPDPSRARVRRVITKVARRWNVDRELALAVAWQESGWQMDRVSSAGAVGAMQVIPSTGRWMSDVVGRRLRLRRTRDNITAGVALLRLLLDSAPRRRAIAGYYQGLAGVRRHGMYDDTKRYVASVRALKRRFERGNLPA